MTFETATHFILRHIASLSFRSLAIILMIASTGTMAFLAYKFLSNQVSLQNSTTIAGVYNVVDTARSSLDRALRETKGVSCSDDFLSSLKKIAFLPDGLNEFMFAPYNKIMCGTTLGRFTKSEALGTPDVREPGSNLSFWFNRELSSIGRPGTHGTIIEQEGFASVIPYFPSSGEQTPWIHTELFATNKKGAIFHLTGDENIVRKSPSSTIGQGWLNGLFQSVSCHSNQVFCVATQFDIQTFFYHNVTIIFFALALIYALTWWAILSLHLLLERYNSFDARFLRHLSAENIVPYYQPILDIRTGRISGCEVLARFRDVDGTIVTPDKFLDVVTRAGLTIEFTKLLVDRAYEELSHLVPSHQQFQVNFNVFPRDATNPDILDVFTKFQDSSDPRFSLVVEIVETEELELPKIKKALKIFKSAGIKVYIDDFGTGYSSLENLFSLPFDGTKLDRSFALAPPESLMGKMFIQILNLLKASKRPIVVEGIESFSLLGMLQKTGNAQFAQGYAISKPVCATKFAELFVMKFDFELNRDAA
jgi:sensor c-di-GMP phosphodiesterase-like protein